jgi:hypothetical protein
MLKALGNVMPRHLLDRRLNPARDVSRAVGREIDLLGDLSPDTPIIPLLTARAAR